ncbi:MAG: type II secretion system protein [Arenicellales bacterium]
MRSISSIRGQRGFSLVTLSIWMIVLGIAAAVMLALLPNRSDQVRMDQTISTIGDARDDVLAFVVKNSRLPAPDSNNDGSENAGADTGALPYRSMGLPESLLDQASLPVHYTPYKDGSLDLTAVTNLYTPDLPDLSGLQAKVVTNGATVGTDSSHTLTGDTAPTIDQCTQEAGAVSTTPNLLDFCTALDQAVAAAATLDSVNVVRCGTTSPCPPSSVTVSDVENVAYVLVSGGLENANGTGTDPSLDGLNENTWTYEDPARGRGKGYDDIVRAVRFSTLQRQLSCKALIDSVNMLATVAAAQESTMENAISAYNDAETEVTMASVTVLLDVVATIQNVVSIAGVIEDIAESAAGCAAAVFDFGATAECCAALAGNIAALVVYTVSTVAQIVALGVDIARLIDATNNRDVFLHNILPEVNAHLCSAIAEVVAADKRGGLATTPVATLVEPTPPNGYPLNHNP